MQAPTIDIQQDNTLHYLLNDETNVSMTAVQHQIVKTIAKHPKITSIEQKAKTTTWSMLVTKAHATVVSNHSVWAT